MESPEFLSQATYSSPSPVNSEVASYATAFESDIRKKESPRTDKDTFGTPIIEQTLQDQEDDDFSRDRVVEQTQQPDDDDDDVSTTNPTPPRKINLDNNLRIKRKPPRKRKILSPIQEKETEEQIDSADSADETDLIEGGPNKLKEGNTYLFGDTLEISEILCSKSSESKKVCRVVNRLTGKYHLIEYNVIREFFPQDLLNFYENCVATSFS